MNKDSIGNRMKNNYEDRYRIKLTRRMPVIIRLDGKAFHTLTKNCEKPFDHPFKDAMIYACSYLIDNIQGAKCIYTQSDEISILLTDFDKLTTDAWFDYNLQKMISISASFASVKFNEYWNKIFPGKYGFFDARCFNIPKEEVCNYFIWRQQDWIRNSIQMLAQSHYSHKELHKKNTKDMHEMLHQKEVNWNNLDSVWKNGTFIHFDGIIYHDVIFTKERDIIEELLIPIEE